MSWQFDGEAVSACPIKVYFCAAEVLVNLGQAAVLRLRKELEDKKSRCNKDCGVQ